MRFTPFLIIKSKKDSFISSGLHSIVNSNFLLLLNKFIILNNLFNKVSLKTDGVPPPI